MPTNDATIGKSRRIAGNILIFLLGLVLVASAGAKLAHVPKVAEQMGLAGIDGWRLTFAGFLEVTSAHAKISVIQSPGAPSGSNLVLNLGRRAA